MKKQKWVVLAAGFALLAILLAACGAASPAVTEAPAPESAVAEDEGAPANTAVAEPVAAETTEAEVVSQPTPRAGLEATDPATVVLASGSYQLVEFFAFW